MNRSRRFAFLGLLLLRALWPEYWTAARLAEVAFQDGEVAGVDEAVEVCVRRAGATLAEQALQGVEVGRVDDVVAGAGVSVAAPLRACLEAALAA